MISDNWIGQLATLPVIGGAFLWLEARKVDRKECVLMKESIDSRFKDLNGDVKEIKADVKTLVNLHLKGGGDSS